MRNLFKQTFLYGLVTILPRMMSFLLLPLYTFYLPEAEYGEVSIIFAWIVFFNVLLSYGMETAFFRFYHDPDTREDVMGTSVISLLISTSVFTSLGFIFLPQISALTEISIHYLRPVLWILALDALVIIPFAWLRATQKAGIYSLVKILNVAINIGLNIFFLVYLGKQAENIPLFQSIYEPDNEIWYIFLANLLASLLTFFVLFPIYFRARLRLSATLLKRMLVYGLPILIAGIAFAINEVFDKILLGWLLPPEIAKEQVGTYAACYRLGVFMTIFVTAFRLGIEPFFFSHSREANARQTYAILTKYFVILGGMILLVVCVFADILKLLLLKQEGFWEAMTIVPIILLANLFLGIYHNLSVWYKVTDRTDFGAYISLLGAAVTLGLNFALIPIIGYLGSAISTLAAYGLMMTVSYFFGKKYYKIEYEIGQIGSYLGLAIICSGIYFYFLRGHLLIGILMIFAYLALTGYFERVTIKRLIFNRR